MTERRSSVRSNISNDNDDQLLDITTTSAQRQERDSLNVPYQTIAGINSRNDKDSDTEELLSEHHVQAPSSDTVHRSKVPARYVTAIWAFFGFFCLYAMRVNLSVAIVAMVRVHSLRNYDGKRCLR